MPHRPIDAMRRHLDSRRASMVVTATLCAALAGADRVGAGRAAGGSAILGLEGGQEPARTGPSPSTLDTTSGGYPDWNPNAEGQRPGEIQRTEKYSVEAVCENGVVVYYFYPLYLRLDTNAFVKDRQGRIRTQTNVPCQPDRETAAGGSGRRGGGGAGRPPRGRTATPADLQRIEQERIRRGWIPPPPRAGTTAPAIDPSRFPPVLRDAVYHAHWVCQNGRWVFVQDEYYPGATEPRRVRLHPRNPTDLHEPCEEGAPSRAGSDTSGSGSAGDPPKPAGATGDTPGPGRTQSPPPPAEAPPSAPAPGPEGPRRDVGSNPTPGNRERIQGRAPAWRDGEVTIRVSAAWVGESAAGLIDPRAGTPPPSLDLPALELRARVTLQPGGPSVRDRQWFFGVGNRVFVGSRFPPPNHAPMTYWAPTFDGRNPAEGIEVDDPSLSSLDYLAGNASSSHVLRGGWEALETEVLQHLPEYVDDVLAQTLEGRRTPVELFAEPFADARIEVKEQNQVSMTTGVSGSAVGQRQPDAGAALERWVWAARNLVEMLRPTLAPAVRASRLPPGVRLVTGPAGRHEYWIDPAPGMQKPASPQRLSLKVFLQGLGRSSGENAQQATFINDGNVPVRLLEDDVFVTEPLSDISQQALARELGKYAGRPRMTMNLTAYCLDYRKPPPAAGRVFRVAARATQAGIGPVRRIVRAAERLRQTGQLHADGDPLQYFHSVRQWAIWAREQRLSEQTYGDALVEHTRKNLLGAGKRWTKEFDAAVRALVPNRWRDIQRVLAEAERYQPGGGR